MPETRCGGSLRDQVARRYGPARYSPKKVGTTWYWGDSNDWLLDAAPEVTETKIAFNVLYGTAPLLWTAPGGSWDKDRDVFLRVYRNVCKLHEAIAEREMRNHEFVTADRAVQKTEFSDGTIAMVNFGERPCRVTLRARSHILPQNGFAVAGPGIQQYREIIRGEVVTEMCAPGYRFTDRADGAE